MQWTPSINILVLSLLTVVDSDTQTLYMRFRVRERQLKIEKQTKTYNSRYSLVVTHLTTNLPVSCLYMAERTGSLDLKILWSYVRA